MWCINIDIGNRRKWQNPILVCITWLSSKTTGYIYIWRKHEWPMPDVVSFSEHGRMTWPYLKQNESNQESPNPSSICMSNYKVGLTKRTHNLLGVWAKRDSYRSWSSFYLSISPIQHACMTPSTAYVWPVGSFFLYFLDTQLREWELPLFLFHYYLSNANHNSQMSVCVCICGDAEQAVTSILFLLVVPLKCTVLRVKNVNFYKFTFKTVLKQV